jgi:D-aminoacyl-tRNA deacylase
VHVEGHVVEALDEDPRVHLLRTHRLHLHADPLEPALADAGLRPEAIVFLSKHKAASGRPALTVHPIGNYGPAEYGGQAGRLSPAAPALQSELLRALATRAVAHAYPAEVTFEVTHHGPLLTTPACFLELGSSEAQWGDAAGARIVAGALLDVVRSGLPEYPIAIGLGGGHYGPRFTEATLTQCVHFGHLVPSHAAESATDAGRLLRTAVAATPGAAGIYAHRKRVDKAVLARFQEAAGAQGVAWLDSASWSPLMPRPQMQP